MPFVIAPDSSISRIWGSSWLTGDSVAQWADTLTINAVGTMKPLQARYNIFCNEGGGAHDDTIFYRLNTVGCSWSTHPTRRRCGSFSTTAPRGG